MCTYRTPGRFTLDGKHDQTFTDLGRRHISERLPFSPRPRPGAAVEVQVHRDILLRFAFGSAQLLAAMKYVLRMSPSTCKASTEVKPASLSISRAVCSPHIVPRPMPPWARETVMQCMHEAVYRNGPSGWSRFSASLLDAAMSTQRYTPPGRS